MPFLGSGVERLMRVKIYGSGSMVARSAERGSLYGVEPSTRLWATERDKKGSGWKYFAAVTTSGRRDLVKQAYELRGTGPVSLAKRTT